MRAPATIAVTVSLAAALLVAAGCGYGGTFTSNGQGGFSPATYKVEGLSGTPSLVVANDVAGGYLPLVAVVLEDPVSGEVLAYRAVTVPPGEGVYLMDMPEGPYRVRAQYEDGRWSPEAPAPGILVRIIHDVDTAVVFHHP